MEKKYDKVVAGVLAILLGGLGIHLFYLGCNKKGLYYLLGSFVIGFAVTILTFVTFGLGFFLYALCYIPAILGIIHGIHYLTDPSQEAFEARVEEEKDKILNWTIK